MSQLHDTNTPVPPASTETTIDSGAETQTNTVVSEREDIVNIMPSPTTSVMTDASLESVIYQHILPLHI